MSALLSGQTTVTSAGTAVQVHSGLRANGPVMLKALPSNSGLIYVGNVGGDVDANNGMPLDAGEVVIIPFVGNLSSLWVDAAENGDKIAWLVLDA
jgi:hypothetical protein